MSLSLCPCGSWGFPIPRSFLLRGDFFPSTFCFLLPFIVPLCQDFDLTFYSWYLVCMVLFFRSHTSPVGIEMYFDVLWYAVSVPGNLISLCTFYECGTVFWFDLAVSGVHLLPVLCSWLCCYTLSFLTSFVVSVIVGPVDDDRFSAMRYLSWLHIGVYLL